MLLILCFPPLMLSHHHRPSQLLRMQFQQQHARTYSCAHVHAPL